MATPYRICADDIVSYREVRCKLCFEYVITTVASWCRDCWDWWLYCDSAQWELPCMRIMYDDIFIYGYKKGST